jgi:hypothetical protein
MQHDAITSAWAPFFNGVTVLSAVVKNRRPTKKSRSRGFFTIRRLDLVDRVFDVFFCIAQASLRFAFGLICQALGLLFGAAYNFTSGFLDFAADVFQVAFDLIFVHGALLKVVQAGSGDVMNRL